MSPDSFILMFEFFKLENYLNIYLLFYGMPFLISIIDKKGTNRLFACSLNLRIKTSQYGPRGVGCWRAAKVLTKGSNEVIWSKSYKIRLVVTDCSLKPGYMKKELLVIVDQYRYGEIKIWGVLTTRQVERGVYTRRALFYILCRLYLSNNIYNDRYILSISH